MSQRVQFRRQAKDHRDAARSLFETGDDELLPASALRLRMSIECLAYEMLQALGDDVSPETMETWQPSRLIKELKEIDPRIDQDVTIRIGVEKVSGQPAEEMTELGTVARPSARWISKEWNALGSYLHAPTIRQIKAGQTLSFEKLRAKLEKVLPEVDRVLDANLFSINIRETIDVTCDCGFMVKRRESLLVKELKATCANCGAMLGAEQKDDGWVFFRLFHNFDCPRCKKKNNFPAQKLKDGVVLTCGGCGALVGIEKDWCVRLKEAP